MLTCKNGCRLPVATNSEECACCVARAAGAAEEQARILVLLRAKIEAHRAEAQSCYFSETAVVHSACADVLTELADKIEREI